MQPTSSEQGESLRTTITPDPFKQFAETTSIRSDLRAVSIRSAAYLAAASVGDFALRLGSTLVLARLLLPEDFGLVGMVTVVTAVAEQVSALGLSTATVQRKDITHEQVSTLFWVNTVVGFIIALSLALLSPVLASYYRDPRLIPITLALSVNFVLIGLTVQHEALLNRQMKQRQASLVRLGASVLSTGLAILLALWGYGYWALIWREIIRSALIVAGVWVSCPWIPGRPRRDADVSSLLRFGAELSLNQFLTTLVSNIDRVLIGRFFGAVTLGMYYQAKQLIVVALDQLSGPITGVSQPGLSALQDHREQYRRYYQKIVSVVALATMPMCGFAAVYANELTLFLLGERWAQTGVFLRIFAVTGFIRVVLGTTGVVLITSGHSRRILKIGMLRNTALIALTFAGISWGAVGVALAQLATALFMTLPSLYYTFPSTPVTAGNFLQALRTPVTAGLTMVSGLLVFRQVMPDMSVVPTIALGAAVSACLYVVTCLWLPGGRRELTELWNDLGAVLSRKSPTSSPASVPVV